MYPDKSHEVMDVDEDVEHLGICLHCLQEAFYTRHVSHGPSLRLLPLNDHDLLLHIFQGRAFELGQLLGGEAFLEVGENPFERVCENPFERVGWLLGHACAETRSLSNAVPLKCGPSRAIAGRKDA